ncbi:MAG: LCP family protein, partial [Chloroflexales bacterium]|nr:LCP family protein [Chloroflexales bacterium]
MIFVLASVVVMNLAHRATQTLEAIEQVDPRRPQASIPSAPDASPVPLPDTLREPFNVLLIGVDRRADPDNGIRSDTLIVVHVNPSERWAGMLSIPRDSVVQIPHLGQMKINVAYSYGYTNAAELYGRGVDPAAAGGALAAETVEDFLNLKINYIAQVDFQGFERIVDTLGGITVDVAQPLLDPEYPTENYGYERLYVPA